MKRSTIHQACVCALSLVVLIGGCSRDSGDPVAPPPMPVKVVTPLVRDIVEWDEFTGRLQPVERVDIQARVSGYLQSAYFEEGQIVQKGDLLVRIDPRPFEVAVASAKATLEQAQASLRLAETRVVQAQAERDQAVSAEQLAETRLENARQAASTNAIALEQVDARESEYTQAKAQRASAESAIAGAEAEIATAQAAILSAQATLDSANLDLEYTEIHAPITGRISRLLVTKGNLIQGGGGGATLLTTIVSTDPIYIFIEASEQELLRYLRNATLEERLSNEFRHPFFLKLIDEEGYQHSGQIDFAENQVDQSTGTLLVRGVLPNPDLVLIPGVFATVQIPSAIRDTGAALLIPDTAIVSDQTQRLVMTVNEQGVVVPKPVDLGPMARGLRVIRSGITAEDRVIVGGLQLAFPGSVVAPTVGEIQEGTDIEGLPDQVSPIPRSDWILIPRDVVPEGSE